MDKQTKERLIGDLHVRLEKSVGIFLVDYKGLNVETMNGLRRELAKVGTELQVVKNRLLKRASEELDTVLLRDYMEGPTAIALTYKDQVGPAKVLVDFAEKHDQLKIKSGLISGKLVSVEATKRLAELPGKDELMAQTLRTMQAVPESFVRVLNAPVMGLLNVLGAIEQQKGD